MHAHQCDCVGAGAGEQGREAYHGIPVGAVVRVYAVIVANVRAYITSGEENRVVVTVLSEHLVIITVFNDVGVVVGCDVYSTIIIIAEPEGSPLLCSPTISSVRTLPEWGGRQRPIWPNGNRHSAYFPMSAIFISADVALSAASPNYA
jgi:hypothetical protein